MICLPPKDSTNGRNYLAISIRVFYYLIFGVTIGRLLKKVSVPLSFEVSVVIIDDVQ
jgi:hypothetical protein